MFEKPLFSYECTDVQDVYVCCIRSDVYGADMQIICDQNKLRANICCRYSLQLVTPRLF